MSTTECPKVVDELKQRHLAHLGLLELVAEEHRDVANRKRKSYEAFSSSFSSPPSPFLSPSTPPPSPSAT